MKRWRRRQRRRRDSHHHILPRSRGGAGGPNISMICGGCHKYYHNSEGLNFGNMTPDEIVEFLVDYYWNGQWEWVELALANHQEGKSIK